MPLFQDMLEICFNRAHPEAKDRPDPREFPTAKELAALAAKAKSEREYRQRRKAEGHQQHRRLTHEQQAQKNLRRRTLYEGQRRAKALANSASYRSDPQNRYRISEQRSNHHWKCSYSARKASTIRAASLQTGSLAALFDNPTFLVIDANGRRTRESWPIDDDAAHWLAENDPGHPTAQVSTKPLDTNIAQA